MLKERSSLQHVAMNKYFFLIPLVVKNKNFFKENESLKYYCTTVSGIATVSGHIFRLPSHSKNLITSIKTSARHIPNYTNI